MSSLADKSQPYILDSIWLPKIDVPGPTAALRAYLALVEYVLENALDPNCFGITYDRIADLSGYACKGTTWKAVNAAIDAGLIVRLDSGLPRIERRQGLCALYALVGNHNNPALAFTAGADTVMYRERSEERRRRGLEPLPDRNAMTSEAA